MESITDLSRRSFVRVAALAVLAGPTILTSRGLGARSANDRINLGFIGVGIMGRGHVHGFLNSPEVQVVAICDVMAARREHSQRDVEKHYAGQNGKGTYKGCKVYNDFRELLERKDIDAVLIATEWPEFRDVSVEHAVRTMREAVVFDPGRFLEKSLGNDERIRYFAIGKPAGKNLRGTYVSN